jgi:polyisoprenoid-binding protein YceI
MQGLRHCVVALSLIANIGMFDHQLTHASRASLLAGNHGTPSAIAKINEISIKPNLSQKAATQRYVLDPSQSKFIAHAFAGGLLWFKGHDHLVAVREFTGEVRLTPDSITPASLEITAQARSMMETSSVFTEPQKQIINKELREIVLLPDQYPEIIFKSTNVTGKPPTTDQYDLKIAGDLTLHGVTRPITIPTKVTLTGSELRAQGEFSIDRGDFKVKATSAVHGLVRVRNKIKFTFDIIGHKI